MQTLASISIIELSQLKSKIQELKASQSRLESQASKARRDASSLMIEAADKEAQSKTLNEKIDELEQQLIRAQGELCQKQREELEGYKAGARCTIEQTNEYNSDLDFLIQEALSMKS